jgi:hypothetical protein
MGKFSQSIKQQRIRILNDVNAKCITVAWYLFNSVVQLTPSPVNPGPWAKGLLANQWYPQEGGTSSAKGSAKSDSGADSYNRIATLLRNSREFYNKDGRITLTNNIDYVMLAERDGWQPPQWSGKRPYMMAKLSLDATVARYKKMKV